MPTLTTIYCPLTSITDVLMFMTVLAIGTLLVNGIPRPLRSVSV